ncbi:MAG: FapA family protein [Pseudomonadota bacterium]|nr:FapA family protein [Pseudomonadota bacterium]MEA3241465.1 FapA family protein [Pseudomonadota bacterium]
MSYQVTLYSQNPRQDPVQDSQQIDYHEQHFIENVVVRQVLARIKPLSENYFPESSEVETRQFFVVEDPSELLGENVTIPEDDPQIIVSTTNGYVKVENNRIEVRDTLIIDGDVNFKTGNLDFIGKIIVRGSVFSGFSVKAKQLIVEGSIEGAHIEIDEDLIVRGGIIACQEKGVYCGGTILTKYVENSRIQARGNIFIEKSALHSQIITAGSIIFLHEPGVIVGGTCQVKNSIYAKIVGAKWATATKISLGVDPFRLQEKDKQQEAVHKIQDDLQSLQGRLEEIHLFFEQEHEQVSRKETKALQEEQELLQAKLLYLGERVMAEQKKLNSLEDAITLEQEINANCRLYAFDTIFPGVEIKIKESNIKSDSIHKGVFYYEENQEIKTGKT